MYVNKCIKCGREFETKNPKRVICPDCLYPDKSMMITPSAPSADEQKTETPISQEPLNGYSAGGTEEPPRYYSAGGNPEPQRYQRPQRNYQNNNYSNRGGYNRNNNNRNRDNRGGYNRSQGGYRSSQGGYNRNNSFQNRRPGGRPNFQNKRPKNKGPKQLLVSKEQLEQIEKLYKAMLPLPNPDCHEVIGEKIGTSGNVECAKMIFETVNSFCNEKGIFFKYSCFCIKNKNNNKVKLTLNT